MLARNISAWLGRRGIHYGWVVVAATFVTALTTAGAVGLPGVMIRPLSAEFGWDTAGISSALALRLVLFGLMAPFAAALMLRYGVRRVALAAVALVAAGLLSATVMTQLWHLVLLWGVVVGVGTGMTAMVLGATVAGRWFTAQRGLVLGMLTAATATGQLIFLPLAAWLVEHAGWRAALLPVLLGLALAAIGLVLFMRERPADLGLAPYGDPPGTVPVPPPSGPSPVAAAFATLAEAARTRTFWILFGTFFVCGLSTNGLVQTHFISLCGDYGMDGVEAASVLAMMGAFDFVGTIASGWLSDRYDSRKLLFWYYGLRGLSLLFLPASTFTFYGLAIFAVFYGLDWIATVPPTVRLCAQTWGRERAPLVFGWVFTGHQLGAAVAAMGAGLSRTLWDTYLPAFYIAGAMCLVAAAASLAIRRAAPPAAPVAIPGAAVPGGAPAPA